MINNTSALGFKGITEWLLVRLTAIFLFFYILYISQFIFFNNNITYDIWINFFSTYTFKILTLIFLFSMVIHSWIGIWQIITDYINNIKLNYILQYLSILLLVIYMFIGITVIFEV